MGYCCLWWPWLVGAAGEGWVPRIWVLHRGSELFFCVPEGSCWAAMPGPLAPSCQHDPFSRVSLTSERFPPHSIETSVGGNSGRSKQGKRRRRRSTKRRSMTTSMIMLLFKTESYHKINVKRLKEGPLQGPLIPIHYIPNIKGPS